jgi:hypothetical protein
MTDMISEDVEFFDRLKRFSELEDKRIRQQILFRSDAKDWRSLYLTSEHYVYFPERKQYILSNDVIEFLENIEGKFYTTAETVFNSSDLYSKIIYFNDSNDYIHFKLAFK